MRPMHMTIGLVGWLAAASVALGQFQVQGGNALDANRRIGSGGLNSAGRQYQINSGNRFIQGNVTGGQAFRGYSPIRDASSLFLGSPNTTGGVAGLSGNYGNQYVLPSDRLDSFRRDSYSAADVQYFRTRAAQVGSPYYSRTSTVASTGDIARGANQPGTSQFISPYQVPGAADHRGLMNPLEGDSGSLLGRANAVQPQLVRAAGTTPNINPRLQASPLFAGVQRIPLANLAQQAETAAATRRDAPGRAIRPVDQRVEGSGSALDLRTGDLRTRGPIDTTASAAMERLMGAQPRPNQAGPGFQDQPTAGSGLLGNQIPADSGGLRRPLGPGTAEQQPPGAEQAPAEVAPGWLPDADAPMRSFAGTRHVGSQMESAEAFLKQGQYYKAAEAFQMAGVVNPDNPLPRVGRAMSLLAAGDYATSTNELFTALNTHEELSTVAIDLTAFVPDLRHLDRRRAELEQRLATYDDFRLRFLLGWAEYYSGMQEAGLANMQKAATQVPASFDGVREFVHRLEIRQTGGEHIQVPTQASRPG